MNLFAQTSSTTTTTTTEIDPAGAAAISGTILLFWLVIAVVSIVGMWKVFEKAGKPGWAALIPIYNTVILLEIAGKELWWILLFFVPFVNIIAIVVVMLALAEKFGQSEVFAVLGLIFFSPIGFLILGFGDATYQGAVATTAQDQVPPTTPPVAPSATPPAAV